MAAPGKKSSCPQPIGFRHQQDLYEIEEDLAFSPPTAAAGPIFKVPITRNRTWGFETSEDVSPRTSMAQTTLQGAWMLAVK